MKYTVKIESPQHAVAETKKWFGPKGFKKVEQDFILPIFKSKNSRSDKLRMLYTGMAMGGVTGRGVIHGLFRFYSNPQPSITHSRTVIEAQAKVVA